MRELNKEKIYDLSYLTSEEYEKLFKWLLDNDSGWRNVDFKYWINENDGFNLKHNGRGWSMQEVKPTHNAKELFYTLENVQVDCRELSEEQIKEMADVFENNGYDNSSIGLEVKDIYFLLRQRWGKEDRNFGVLGDHKDGRFTTITYEKFMELFAEPKEEKPLQPHYDNTNGSIYKFCNDQKLNSWEFDIIKRVVRCRKKGLFKEDLQKTKDLIDLYLKEFTDEK